MFNEIERKAAKKMEASIQALKNELAKIRTSRVHPALLEHLTVEHYGANYPLNQLASITVEGNSTLVLSVWDKQSVEAIEKAIAASGLGLNPAVSGMLVRVPVPPLTEERRKELAKLVRQHAEKTRVSLRNFRREAKQQIKDALKAKAISQDEEKDGEKEIQQLLDQRIAVVDEILASKEKDLMSF